jgi:hypothetical protein
MVSAGHTTHEWTSASAFDNLFETIDQKLAAKRSATACNKL